jgi:hypothetical protein
MRLHKGPWMYYPKRRQTRKTISDGSNWPKSAVSQGFLGPAWPRTRAKTCENCQKGALFGSLCRGSAYFQGEYGTPSLITVLVKRTRGHQGSLRPRDPEKGVGKPLITLIQLRNRPFFDTFLAKSARQVPFTCCEAVFRPSPDQKTKMYLRVEGGI